jgi:ubiquinone/menaquinone biosynthesis C-methylase UbiE
MRSGHLCRPSSNRRVFGAKRVALTGGLASASAIGAAYWMRKHPSPIPYSQRRMLDMPQPLVTKRRLHGILRPKLCECILEVGPGTGHYTVALADWVGQEGTISVLDIQQDFLDHTMRRAARQGLPNVSPCLGDVQALPYENSIFDAVVVIGVLGEVPNRSLALRELHRVTKCKGRLIVGEFFPPDPHVQPFTRLRPHIEAAGFTLVHRTGVNIGYFAHFAPRMSV